MQWICRLPGCLLFCLNLLLSGSALALDTQATKAEKPHNAPGIVYSIAQDQQDFIWLASEFEGLLRFDGEAYLRFSPPPPQPLSSFSQVRTGRDNQLWLGTWGHGLWQLNAKRNQWQQIGAPLPPDARVQSLLYDQRDDLWIGTTKGLYLLKAGQAQVQAIAALQDQRIWQLAAQQDNLWVGTSNGLYQLNRNNLSQGHWASHPKLQHSEVRAISVQEQSLLVGLRSEVLLTDLSGQQVTQQHPLGNSNSFLSDGTGRWLVGSIDGFYLLTQRDSGLQSEMVLPAVDARTLFRDKRGTVWLGSRNNGLLRLPDPPLPALQPSISTYLSEQHKHRLGPPSVTADARWQPLEHSLLRLKDGQWQQLQFAAEHQVAYVRDVVDFAGMTLVGTDQGLYRLQDGQQLQSVPLSAKAPRLNIERMVRAPDGALWLGLWEHGVYRIAAPTAAAPTTLAPPVQLLAQQSQEGIIDIQADPQQQLWLLSRKGMLYQASPDQLQLRWQPDAALATSYFHCLLADADVFWLCTDRGLLKLSKDLQHAELLGLAHGLPDARIIGIARSATLIWILTRNGVMAFEPGNNAIHLLSPRPGLDLRTAQLRGLQTLSGDQVQLATTAGLWQLSRTDLTKVPPDMQLHLTELRLNQQLYSLAAPDASLSLPADVHELQLKFRLLSYQPHLQVNYFFRWNGQPAWTAFGPEAVLTLSQLAPGAHQLEVMAQAGGQFVYTKPLQLRVPMPWWRQPAGLFAIFSVTGWLLYLVYRYRVRRLQQRAKQLDLLVAERTAALEAANLQLQHLSNTDSLTGLMNRRALQYAAGLLQAQRNRHAAPLTLVLLDIDHFKQINDIHGHDAGDEVLRQVAGYLRQRLRSQDLLARWGGEEFLLLMPNTNMAQAQQLVDEVRLGIRRLDTSPLDVALSATFGISPVATSALALEQAIKAADLALYRGKAQGRDQVVLAALPD